MLRNSKLNVFCRISTHGMHRKYILPWVSNFCQQNVYTGLHSQNWEAFSPPHRERPQNYLQGYSFFITALYRKKCKVSGLSSCLYLFLFWDWSFGGIASETKQAFASNSSNIRVAVWSSELFAVPCLPTACCCQWEIQIDRRVLHQNCITRQAINLWQQNFNRLNIRYCASWRL